MFLFEFLLNNEVEMVTLVAYLTAQTIFCTLLGFFVVFCNDEAKSPKAEDPVKRGKSNGWECVWKSGNKLFVRYFDGGA